MDDVTNASEERDISELNIATADMILNPDPRGEGHADDENAEEEEDDEEETMIDELTAEEYASVDRALDEMMSFMDVLEERSDSLYAKMQELLADSRQARLEMQAARAPDDDVQSKPSAEDPP